MIFIPTEQAHKEQARQNEYAIGRIEAQHPDWVVTLCFYAALHWVEFYAKAEGTNIFHEYEDAGSPHDRRRDYLSDVAYYYLNAKKLYKAYTALEDESKVARYLKGIDVDARQYYIKNDTKVRESKNNLRIVKHFLS